MDYMDDEFDDEFESENEFDNQFSNNDGDENGDDDGDGEDRDDDGSINIEFNIEATPKKSADSSAAQESDEDTKETDAQSDSELAPRDDDKKTPAKPPKGEQGRIQKAIEKLLREDKRFPLGAYAFVSDLIGFTQRMGVSEMKRTEQKDGSVAENEEPHITGQILCRFAVAFAVSQYGMLAREVLESLGIRTTSDIGDVVFNLIKAGALVKSPDDSREDFDDLFDLGAELDSAFEFSYKKPRR